jgi:hypothetical protein
MDVQERLRQLREEFREVHRRGMKALEAGDLEAVGAAIAREGLIFEEQARLWDELQAALRRT